MHQVVGTFTQVILVFVLGARMLGAAFLLVRSQQRFWRS
jgi:hypothetical protein